jgi:hypothetical protein
VNGIEKMLELTTMVSSTNIHMFNYEGKLHKYENAGEIVEEFSRIRLDTYEKRRLAQIETLREELIRLSNHALYIMKVLDGSIDLRRKSTAQVDELLGSYGLVKIDGNYHYLTKLPMDSVTSENVELILNKKRNKEQELEIMMGLTSRKMWGLELDELETQKDYLQVGGVLDNVCNAACQTCSPECSTRIGALTGRTFPIVDNSNRFWELPQERIRHLDINGGEPSYSKNYKRILANLPPNLRTLRLNTNCNIVLEELTKIANRGIEVTVTVSCDGIGTVHEYMRWPIAWETFYDNLMQYKTMPVKLNLWTTVSILNVADLPNIQAFAQEHGIDHGYAYLKHPYELSVDNTNVETRQAYISKQKQLRGMI